jgi:hypothetical protein
VWTYVSRTLADGTPDAPASPEEWIAKGIWEYVSRTLGEGGPIPTHAIPAVYPFVIPGSVRATQQTDGPPLLLAAGSVEVCL